MSSPPTAPITASSADVTVAADAKTTDIQPPGPGRRLPALDVLRGIAILGTLLTNIGIFAYSVAPQIRGDVPGQDFSGAVIRAGDLISRGLGLVTDGKFIGLLTIMFGIGLEIQRQSAIRRGEKWPGRYPWRAGLLILDGLLNYIFIFEFDVLMGYGLTALVVAAIMASSPRAQKIWMIVGVTAHVIAMGALTIFEGGRGGAKGPREVIPLDPDAGSLMRQGEILRDLSGLPDGGEGMRNVGTDSYPAMVIDRFTNFFAGRSEIPIMFLMGLGLFLVGAHLYRAGIFEERGRTLRIRVMALSFGLGLPLDWYLRLAHTDASGTFTRYVTSSMVAFGVLALGATVYVNKTGTGPIGTALSWVGRMALTCYVSQNLIASIIFYDWGFGVSRKIAGPYATFWMLGIYVGIAGFLILFSKLWLDRFSRGPIEWLWHKSFESIGDRLDRRRERKESVASA